MSMSLCLVSFQAALADCTQPERQRLSLTRRLQDDWESACSLILHKEQPVQKDNQTEPKICQQLGCCVCGKGPNSCPDALHFHERLVTLMKHFMLVRDKSKPKSELRVLLEQRLLVFRLVPTFASAEPQQDDGSLYFCVGYINLSSWRFCCVHLRFYSKTEDMLTLQVVRDETQASHLSTRTSAQFFAELIEFERRWAVQFLSIVNDSQLLPHFELEPAFVDVVAKSAVHQFWAGAAEEAESRKVRGRKKTTGRGLPKGKPKPRAAGPKLAPKRRGQGPPLESAIEDALEEWEDNDDRGNAKDAEASASEGSIEADLAADEDDGSDEGSIGSASVRSILEEASLADLVEHVPQMEAPPPQEEPPHPDPPGADAAAAGSSEPQPRDVAQRRPVVGEVSVGVGSLGEIRCNKAGFMRAFCNEHSIPGFQCVRQRTTKGSVGGRGRPIGELVAWLQSGVDLMTPDEHGKAAGGTLAERTQAREWFYTLPGGQRFAELHERKQGSGEPEEPLKVHKVRGSG